MEGSYKSGAVRNRPSAVSNRERTRWSSEEDSSSSISDDYHHRGMEKYRGRLNARYHAESSSSCSSDDSSCYYTRRKYSVSRTRSSSSAMSGNRNTGSPPPVRKVAREKGPTLSMESLNKLKGLDGRSTPPSSDDDFLFYNKYGHKVSIDELKRLYKSRKERRKLLKRPSSKLSIEANNLHEELEDIFKKLDLSSEPQPTVSNTGGDTHRIPSKANQNVIPPAVAPASLADYTPVSRPYDPHKPYTDDSDTIAESASLVEGCKEDNALHDKERCDVGVLAVDDAVERELSGLHDYKRELERIKKDMELGNQTDNTIVKKNSISWVITESCLKEEERKLLAEKKQNEILNIISKYPQHIEPTLSDYYNLWKERKEKRNATAIPTGSPPPYLPYGSRVPMEKKNRCADQIPGRTILVEGNRQSEVCTGVRGNKLSSGRDNQVPPVYASTNSSMSNVQSPQEVYIKGSWDSRSGVLRISNDITCDNSLHSQSHATAKIVKTIETSYMPCYNNSKRANSPNTDNDEHNRDPHTSASTPVLGVPHIEETTVHDKKGQTSGRIHDTTTEVKEEPSVNNLTPAGESRDNNIAGGTGEIASSSREEVPQLTLVGSSRRLTGDARESNAENSSDRKELDGDDELYTSDPSVVSFGVVNGSGRMASSKFEYDMNEYYEYENDEYYSDSNMAQLSMYTHPNVNYMQPVMDFYKPIKECKHYHYYSCCKHRHHKRAHDTVMKKKCKHHKCEKHRNATSDPSQTGGKDADTGGHDGNHSVDISLPQCGSASKGQNEHIIEGDGSMISFRCSNDDNQKNDAICTEPPVLYSAGNSLQDNTGEKSEDTVDINTIRLLSDYARINAPNYGTGYTQSPKGTFKRRHSKHKREVTCNPFSVCNKGDVTSFHSVEPSPHPPRVTRISHHKFGYSPIFGSASQTEANHRIAGKQHAIPLDLVDVVTATPSVVSPVTPALGCNSQLRGRFRVFERSVKVRRSRSASLTRNAEYNEIHGADFKRGFLTYPPYGMVSSVCQVQQ